ncbi:DUF262 domain-containing protein [Zunongwangia sp.]|uniref:DUF262 domain-containing protein n=1 Tax=Zunongwangia sp. TaxID=1965325 RepID=UPI003AA9D75E
MTYTFYQLLENNTVKIPLIQRDYAQGRTSVKDLRNSFIEKIKKIINGEDEKLNLDFVYGYTAQSEKDKTDFIPLDGQQRLTTLWLLHWYFAYKKGVLSSKEENTIPNILSKFTYETRISSTRFCEKLVFNAKDVNQISDSLKDTIINMPWFMSSWKNDPTITAMLIMLDTIHEKLKDCENGWYKLTNQNVITFDYIDIKSNEFKLTDELYIKMNSRGKPLTPFENFKAIFSQLLSEKETDYFNEKLSYENSKVTYQQYFAFLVDGKWTDLFWDYREKTESSLDSNFLNFFYYIAEMLHYSQNKENSFERNFESLKRTYFKKSNVDFLFNSLNFLSDLDNIQDFFNSIFSTKSYEEDKVRLFDENNTDLFLKSFSTSSFDVQQRVLLFGILHLCIETSSTIGDSRITDFTRILRNLLLRVRQANNSKRIEIISNLRLPNFFDYSKFVFKYTKKIKEETSKSTFQIFTENSYKGFTKDAIKSEQNKIKIIVDNPHSKTAILKLDDHKYIQGISDVFNLEVNNISEYVEVFYALWSLDEINNSQLVRALLTKGDFSVETHYYSSLGVIKYFGTDGYWNRILAPLDKDELLQNNQTINKFIEDYISSDKETVKEKISDIISSYSSKEKNWRYYFINYSQITSSYYDRFNVFTWGDKDGFSINSLGNSGKQPLASYHLNPYLIAIEKKLNKDGVKSPKVRLCSGRYTDDLSCIALPNKVLLFIDDGYFEIYNLKKHKGFEVLKNEFKLEGNDTFHILKETKTKDKIEIAVDFCKRLIEL